MAERQSMTSAEIVARAIIEEHPDLLRESMATVAHELTEAACCGNRAPLGDGHFPSPHPGFQASELGRPDRRATRR